METPLKEDNQLGTFTNRLAAMQEAWTEGKEGAAGVPDGVYRCQLQLAEMKESQSGRMMIHRETCVLDGDQAGEVVHDYIVIDTDYGPRQLAQFVEQMGHDIPDDLTEIEDIVESISKAAPIYTAHIKKAKDSDMRNVKIREVLEVSTNGASGKKGKKVIKKLGKKKKKEESLVDEWVSFEGEDGDTLEAKVTDQKKDGSVVVETGDGDLYELSKGEFEVLEEEAEAEAEEEEEVEDEVATATADLLAICIAHSIEVSEEDTLEELVGTMMDYEWNSSELTPEEVTILVGAGLEVKEKPKPRPKPAPKKVLKKKPAPKKKGKVRPKKR